MSESNNSSGGVGVVGLLGVVFVVLKLTGVISWSWWYVTMPFWGGLALLAVILIVIGVALGVMWLIEKIAGFIPSRKGFLR